MSARAEDLVHVTSSSAGTGDLVLGSPINAQRFAPSANLDGQMVTWLIRHQTLDEIEVVRAVYDHSPTPTVMRNAATDDDVSQSSNAGGKVAFSAGGLEIAIVRSARDDATVIVDTIADLKTQIPRPGRTIRVLGYTTPGDGGGGLFRADIAGALEMDGATVFCAAADESTEQTVTAIAATSFQAPYALPHTDIVWGSVVLESEEAGNTLDITDLDLNGHRMNSGGVGVNPWFEHKLGRVNDPHDLLFGYYNGRATTTAQIRYKHATNARRWVRDTDGAAVSVKWWGATEGAEERNLICWALNIAKRLGKRAVRLDGDYLYRGSIEIPEGVVLRDGVLTQQDGTAILPMKNDYGTTHPDSEAVTVLGAWGGGIYPEDGASSIGLADLELNGNCLTAYHRNALANLATDYNGTLPGTPSAQEALENTPVWAALSSTAHGGRAVNGLSIYLKNVHIHGYGSNCIVGGYDVMHHAVQVRLGNSAVNHLLYSVHGTWAGLRLYGFCRWAYAKTEAAVFTDLRIEDLTQFPETVPWSQGYVLISYEGLRWGGGLTADEELKYKRQGLIIRGFFFELAGYTIDQGPLFQLAGPHVSISGGTVIGPATHTFDEIVVAQESYLSDPTGADQGLYANWILRDITLQPKNGATFLLTGSQSPKADISLENVTIEPHRLGTAVPAGGAPLALRAEQSARTSPQYALAPRRLAISSSAYKTSFAQLLSYDVSDASAPGMDVAFTDCTLKATSTVLFKSNAGTGELSGMTIQDLTKHRVSMERCRIGIGSGTANHLELFFVATALRQVETIETYVQDDGTLPLKSEVVAVKTGDGVATTFDFKPGLLWAPRELEVHCLTPWSSYEVWDSAGAAKLTTTTTEDKRNPTIKVTFGTAPANGERIVLIAKVGGPGVAHLIEGAAPAGGVGGGISSVGSDAEVELTASTTLNAAAHGPLVISGSSIARRRVMINGAGATTVELTVPSTLDREVEISVDLNHSSSAAIHLIPGAGVTWGDGSTTNPQPMRNNPGSVLIVKPLGDGRFKLLGDVTRRIDLGSNAVSNNRERVYNSLSGAQTLSPTNFQEGSVLVNIGAAAPYTLPSRMTGAGDDVSDSLEVVNEHASDAITLTASGPTLKGATSIPAGASAVIRWFNRSGTEYVVARASA